MSDLNKNKFNDNSRFKIGNKYVGEGFKPYIIAEISGNHCGSIERAKKLIEIAKESGADAVKLQTFRPSTITIPNDDRFKLKSGSWKGENLSDLYERTQTPWAWHEPLFCHAKDANIDIFSSPFDHEAVDFLNDLNVPAFKIASNEVHDWSLIKKITEKGKPIILSTGTSTENILRKTIEFIHLNGCKDIAILHCISAYPSNISEMSLNTISKIKRMFGLPVGISDHSLEIYAAISSIAIGGSIIEKHITISRNDDSPDAKFSLEPQELKKLCQISKDIWLATNGKPIFGGDRDLNKDSIFTRQLWSKSNIKKGDIITWNNIKSIRAPDNENGISSMDFENVLNKISKANIDKDQPLKREYLID